MSPYIETRAFLLPEFMLVVCAVYYADFIRQDFDNSIVFKTIVPVFLFAVMVWGMNDIYNTYKEYYDFSVKREMAVVLSDSDVFYWGKYWGDLSNRVLTTRENYFEKNIEVVDDYVWDIGVNKYADGHAVNGIDELNYDEATHIFTVKGWCAFTDGSSEDDVYICADGGGKSYFFDTLKYSRSDVMPMEQSDIDAVTGYQSSFVMMYTLTQEEKMDLYVCVVDRNEKLVDKIHLGTFYNF